MNTGNAYDIETMRQLDSLAAAIGGIAECKRLGFVHEDERGVMSLSTAGLGYLLSVHAVGVTSLAEAFAAGYQAAHDEAAG
jgi:hypothetical protein